ncbi:MAG: RRQRL motif-containing zinc-binding protein [Streptosporangiales bacterium]
MTNKKAWPYMWQHIDGLGHVLTRGRYDGMPVLTWGWADPAKLATYRQLAARGLRPGGSDPVAVLLFQHRQDGRKATDFASLYLVERALPKRTATPAQREAIAAALAARRTCCECGIEQPYYPSTISRMCSTCEDRTDFWAIYAAEHGYSWGVAA